MKEPGAKASQKRLAVAPPPGLRSWALREPPDPAHLPCLNGDLLGAKRCEPWGKRLPHLLHPAREPRVRQTRMGTAFEINRLRGLGLLCALCQGEVQRATRRFPSEPGTPRGLETV